MKEPICIQTGITCGFPCYDKCPRNKNQVYVTLGWDGAPTIQVDGKYVYPRKAEMIINKKYYPTGKVGEWPRCPETGEKLPISEPDWDKAYWSPNPFRHLVAVLFGILLALGVTILSL